MVGGFVFDAPRDAFVRAALVISRHMKLTNLFNLPDPIYQAVKNDPYHAGNSDYSITGLLKPPRIAQLQRVHDDDIVEDCSDRIFSLIGQAVHGILERAERVGLAEHRYYATVAGKRISGGTDRIVLLDKLLQDYKVTTLWKLKKEDYSEWEAQQNAYRYLLHVNGIEIETLEIVALLRDWSKRKARIEADYPVSQCMVVGLSVWPHEKTVKFLEDRIALHEAAKVTLPLCSREDRWMDDDKWALVRKGNTRATKVVGSFEDAKKIADEDWELEIVPRPAERKRCLDYCQVRNFCQQFKDGL